MSKLVLVTIWTVQCQPKSTILTPLDRLDKDVLKFYFNFFAHLSPVTNETFVSKSVFMLFLMRDIYSSVNVFSNLIRMGLDIP